MDVWDPDNGTVRIGGGNSGIVLLAPTTAIGDPPVTSVVLALTGGYPSYEFEFMNWKGEGTDPTDIIFLGIQVSVDGGATFIGSPSVNFDEYATGYYNARAALTDPTQTAHFSPETDTSGDLGAYDPAGVASYGNCGCSGKITISPGAAGQSFKATFEVDQFTQGKFNHQIGTTIINVGAILFDSSWLARITHICVQFYDSVWNDSKVTAGQYSLRGKL